MPWKVDFHREFEAEFDAFPEKVQEEIMAQLVVLQEDGPHAGRPGIDTLRNSSYNNMKELRVKVDREAWRIAFAFDPERTAILLFAGNKAGVNQNRFYKKLIKKADERFERHLSELEENNGMKA